MAGVGDISGDGTGAGLLHGDEERLEALFKDLDRDGNGRIDIQDLSNSLKDSGVHHTYAKVGVLIFEVTLVSKKCFKMVLVLIFNQWTFCL